MINNGGAEIHYSFKYSEGNEAHEDQLTPLKRTLSVHKDLHDILIKQRPNVLRVEEINYRLAVTTAQQMGIDNLDQLSQIAEGMTQEAIMKIQVTGFRISGKDDKRQVIITYKKQAADKKIIGRSTTNIMLMGDVYGFEEELETDIEYFTKEVYNYIYKNKHSESDQLQFDLFAGDEVEDVEEDEENED